MKVDLSKQWEPGTATIKLEMPVSILPAPKQVKAPVELKADDTKPTVESNEELITKKARLISACVIDHWFPFDLSRKGVLEASLPLMNQNLGLYTDHDKRVKNCVGGVRNCVWNASATPPGIEGDVIVDTKLDPLVARQFEMGWVNRFSMTLMFNWEQSHPDMKRMAFWDQIGEEVNGKIVMPIVTEITYYGEASLVYFGADPNAQVLLSKSEKGNESPDIINLEVKNTMDKKLFERLKVILKNVDGDEPESALVDLLKEYDKKNEKIGALEKQVEEMKPQVELAVKINDAVKADVIRMVKVVEGKESPLMKRMLEAANYDELVSMQSEYMAKMKAKFPATCQSCGSKELEIRSSVELRPDEETEKPVVGFKTIH